MDPNWKCQGEKNGAMADWEETSSIGTLVLILKLDSFVCTFSF
jgi:hypothetical protein